MLKYFISLLAGGISMLALLLLNYFVSLTAFFVIVFFWFAFIIFWHLFIFQKSARKWQDLVLLVATMISLLSLNVLAEESWLRYLIIILAGLIFAFLFSRSPLPEGELPHQQKPIRRIIMMIWIFNAFCLFSLTYALNIYFQNLPFAVLVIILAGVIFYVNLNVWSNYLTLPWKDLALWSGVLSLAVLELCWVMHFLTLDYFALGLVSVWLWYLALLLIRFNLTTQGIVWKKQSWFLVINFALLVLFLLFVVRWL